MHPLKKCLDKLNAARCCVMAFNSVTKGNEVIISILEEVNKEISNLACDGTKVKLGASIQALKLNTAQSVFPLKACLRSAATVMHETRKACFNFATTKVKAEDLVIKKPISGDIFSGASITN